MLSASLIFRCITMHIGNAWILNSFQYGSYYDIRHGLRYLLDECNLSDDNFTMFATMGTHGKSNTESKLSFNHTAFVNCLCTPDSNNPRVS